MKVEPPQETGEPGNVDPTIADHLRERDVVTAWCPRCLNVEPIDLARLVEQGWGERALAALAGHFRCGRCRSRPQFARRRAGS